LKKVVIFQREMIEHDKKWNLSEMMDHEYESNPIVWKGEIRQESFVS